MCQLLGMNCNVPTDICFSFTGFRQRGGRTDHHADGWGIAFFEQAGCRVFIDTEPSVKSPVAELVRHYPIRSTNVIAHIRKATRGRVALANCHPFMRELWGRYWIFAHNGNLKGFRYRPAEAARYRPVGSTDSEAAFCTLLEHLRRAFPAGRPRPRALQRAVAAVAEDLAAHGSFNFLLSNGDVLLAHCSTRLAYIVRKAPFGTAHLMDEDLTVDFRDVTSPEDRVAVIATAPLTDNETWTPLAPGELLMFRGGEPQ
jgi:predicted glutamine amidotransferase